MNMTFGKLPQEETIEYWKSLAPKVWRTRQEMEAKVKELEVRLSGNLRSRKQTEAKLKAIKSILNETAN